MLPTSVMRGAWISARCGPFVFFLSCGLVDAVGSQPSTKVDRTALQAFMTRHCTACHNREVKKGNLALDAVSAAEVSRHPDVWEKVVRKLSARQMPPLGKPRPDERTYDAIVAALEN